MATAGSPGRPSKSDDKEPTDEVERSYDCPLCKTMFHVKWTLVNYPKYEVKLAFQKVSRSKSDFDITFQYENSKDGSMSTTCFTCKSHFILQWDIQEQSKQTNNQAGNITHSYIFPKLIFYMPNPVELPSKKQPSEPSWPRFGSFRKSLRASKKQSSKPSWSRFGSMRKSLGASKKPLRQSRSTDTSGSTGGKQGSKQRTRETYPELLLKRNLSSPECQTVERGIIAVDSPLGKPDDIHKKPSNQSTRSRSAFPVTADTIASNQGKEDVNIHTSSERKPSKQLNRRSPFPISAVRIISGQGEADHTVHENMQSVKPKVADTGIQTQHFDSHIENLGNIFNDIHLAMQLQPTSSKDQKKPKESHGFFSRINPFRKSSPSKAPKREKGSNQEARSQLESIDLLTQQTMEESPGVQPHQTTADASTTSQADTNDRPISCAGDTDFPSIHCSSPDLQTFSKRCDTKEDEYSYWLGEQKDISQGFATLPSKSKVKKDNCNSPGMLKFAFKNLTSEQKRRYYDKGIGVSSSSIVNSSGTNSPNLLSSSSTLDEKSYNQEYML